MWYNICMGVWIDIGCPDFEAAKRNRERCLTPEQLRWWSWYETVVKCWSHSKPLPYWIPQGKLPKIGKRDARHLTDYGMHVIMEDRIEEPYRYPQPPPHYKGTIYYEGRGNDET